MSAFAFVAMHLVATYRRPMFSSPDRLLAATWFVLLGAYLALEDSLVPLSTVFPLYFLSFFIAYLVTFHISRLACAYLPTIRIPKLLAPRPFVIVALVVAFIPLVLAAKLVATYSLNSFMEFRLLTSPDGTSERESIRVGIVFPIACAGWYLARREGYTVLPWILGILVLLLSVVATGKMFLLLFLLFLIPWWRPTINTQRWMLVASAIGLGLFFASHFVLEKFSSDPSQGILQAIGETLKVYALGGIAAFQHVLSGEAPMPQGIMWTPIAGLVEGAVRVPESFILPWTQVGDYYTNVYTAFGYWYEVFGLFSGIAMGIVLGALYGLLFHGDGVPSIAVGFVRTFYLFPLLFIFHQDFFFPSVVMHVGFLASAFLLSLVKTRRHHVPALGATNIRLR